VPAEQAWFVGDDPVWDVAGARAARLRPILRGGRAAHEPSERIGTLRDLVPRIWQNNELHELPRKS
jgi:FMN phosphatase YigB (HAD superfamily)